MLTLLGQLFCILFHWLFCNTTPTTDKNIVNNIMNYPIITIDGQKGSNLNSLTKGQLNFMLKEIDLQNQGYSMSSDPSLFGVVAEGTYIVNRLNPNDRKGPYQSEWTLNNRGKVPANGNINPAHPERNPGYLTGVFIHRPNNNGFAGTYLNKKTNKISGISEGCLLISPKQWDKFNAQLNNIKNFRLQLIRK